MIVTAEAESCAGIQRKYPIIIPGPANIELVPGTGSNNQLVCSGSAIDDIEYHISGAATGVESETTMNLPPGVFPVRQDVIQSTVISLTSNPFFNITTNNKYVTSIDGFDYTYNVNQGDDLDDIGNGVRNSISSVEL